LATEVARDVARKDLSARKKYQNSPTPSKGVGAWSGADLPTEGKERKGRSHEKKVKKQKRQANRNHGSGKKCETTGFVCFRRPVDARRTQKKQKKPTV